MEKNCNNTLTIQQVQHNDRIKAYAEFIINLISTNDATIIETFVKNFNQFEPIETIYAFIIGYKSGRAFCEKFSKCSFSLIKNFKREGMEQFETECYLITSYNYEKRASREFSLQRFICGSVMMNYSEDDFFKIVSKDTKTQLRKMFLDLIHSWSNEDRHALTVFYTNHFQNFVYIFRVLEVTNEKIVKRMHDQCIQYIFKCIKSLDVKQMSLKYSIFKKMQDRLFDLYMQHTETEAQNKFIEEFKDVDPVFKHPYTQIYKQVKSWGGITMISRIMNPILFEDNIEHILDEIKKCK